MKTTHTFTREEVEEMIRSWCGIPKEEEIVIENKIYKISEKLSQGLQTARAELDNVNTVLLTK